MVWVARTLQKAICFTAFVSIGIVVIHINRMSPTMKTKSKYLHDSLFNTLTSSLQSVWDCKPQYTLEDQVIIVGYDRTETVNCTGSLCEMNYGRSPVELLDVQEETLCSSVPSCVTVTVKTKHRLQSVSNMIKSLHKFYPATKVIVADTLNPDYEKTVPKDWRTLLNSSTSGPFITYFQAERGVGKGRTMAAMMAQTKYVLIADDDFIFENETDIHKLLGVLETTDVDIVGGSVKEAFRFDGVFRVWQPGPGEKTADLAVYSGVFYERIPCFSHCYAGDIIKNFFLADREKLLKAGAWDTSRLLYEHEDFFFQMRKMRLKVGHCSDVVMGHDLSDGRLRSERRKQFKTWKQHLLKKWSLHNYYFCHSRDYLKSDKCRPSGHFA